MDERDRWRSRAAARRNAPDMVVGMAGGLVMMVALALAAALAVAFAATLAVITALATALLAVSALAWRVRPRPERALVRSNRGHAWVSYRLDTSPR
jgi:hypothetical protein